MAILQLLIFLALAGTAAVFGSQFQPGQWYADLNKPSWTPPGWVFGPVWTVLYIMIAVAGWLTWRTSRQVWSAPMVLWSVQLLLNAAWSWLFFGRQQPTLAAVDIVLLLATIVGFMVMVWTQSRPAAVLFIPYALWVAFATALNIEIARLNL